MGLLRGMARASVITGTATRTANRVNRRQAARYDNQQAEEAQPAPTTTSVDDTTAQLQQLASLKDQGILTQEEFDAKKKQILGI